MASTAGQEAPVHLVVLCHGLWGEPKHLHTLATLLCRSYGERASISKGTGGKRSKQQVGPGDEGSSSSSADSSESIDALEEARLEAYIAGFIPESRGKQGDMDVVILNSMSNSGSKTYDGIDWIAERAVREVKAEQAEFKRQGRYLARFSIIGYSLGGLVARYAVGLLDSQSFFNPPGGQPVQARHFATFATPHIGVPPANGAFGRLANYIGGRLLSRTGEQLYLLDTGWESEEDIERHKASASTGKLRVGLIESMSRPGSTFIRALNRFDKVTFYANAVNDMTVAFRTGCIEEWDPFHERHGNIDV